MVVRGVSTMSNKFALGLITGIMGSVCHVALLSGWYITGAVLGLCTLCFIADEVSEKH